MTKSSRICLVALVLVSIFLGAHALHGYGQKKRWTLGPREKREVTCDTSSSYRTFDGSCNNVNNPEYGMAGAMFRRILAPQYGDATGNTPRMTGVDGEELPSPRTVSVTVHDAENFTIPRVSQMLMQWAQFLDHDLTHTPTMDFSGTCCYDALVTTDEVHEDVTTGGPCFPIIIDDNDRYFDTVATRCMEFVRSDSMTDDDGVRQQYNEVTPWIDGSQIYGHTDDLAASLRSGTNGKMLVNTIDGSDFLPEDTDAGDETCFKLESGDYCFLAGDLRVNVFPGLSALHTIFVRYHNYMCDRLMAIQPTWDDETLYQEARRIVIAVLQRVTYDEFMISMLGNANSNTYDLLFGDEDYAYDDSTDPTLPNVFSTAAYRFGHSLVTDSLTIGGTIYETGDLYMRPKYVLNSISDVIMATMYEKSQRADRWYSEGITDRMFEKPNAPQSGFDIAARNIQRGRDHGLPPYNDWRVHYGLEKETFDTIEQGGRRFSRVYDSPDDIDLYSGAISEDPYNGARMGELYVNILGQQFRDLKFGDRFWFENQGDSTSFTERQIRELRKIKLAKVICDTVPEITQIPQRSFQLIDDVTNPLVDCSTLRDMDIERRWS